MNSELQKIEEHFNAAAAKWEASPEKQERNLFLYKEILRRVPLQTDMAVAEYGCATGVLSMLLYPHVAKIDAFDLAPLMIEELKKKIAGKDFPHLRPLVLDLQNDNFPSTPVYDILVSAMTLHHVQDVAALVQKFTRALKSSGFLLLADLDAEDGSFHKSDIEGVYHNGFERTQIQKWMQEAGCQNVEIETFYRVRKKEKDYPMFLAKATKK